jgi:hypothetical protein
MTWTRVPIGDYRGLTLPQIMLTDPDWAFWAFDEDVFYGRLGLEAAEIDDKARRIRIRKRRPQRWLVDYRYEDTGGFLGFAFVKARNMPYLGHGHVQLECLDLSRVRANRVYDKRGSRKLIRDFRHYYCDDGNLTKRRCGQFFADDDNFVEVPD